MSELYGLTRADIDFERHCIHVRRQLCRTAEKPYFVTPPKTKSGIRNVPMTDTGLHGVEASSESQNIPRKWKCWWTVTADSSFWTSPGCRRLRCTWRTICEVCKRDLKRHTAKPVPRITPHVLRHTFCTNVQQAGLDVKSLQYLMGHSNASVTLDVYTHSSFESVERAFEQITGNL